MFNLFKKKTYMGWEEYSQRVADREALGFLDQTASTSIKNYWRKQNDK